MRLTTLLVALLCLVPFPALAASPDEDLLSGKAIEGLVQSAGYAAVGTSMRTVPWKELVAAGLTPTGTVNVVKTNYGIVSSRPHNREVVLTWQRPAVPASPDLHLKSHTTLAYFTGRGRVNVLNVIPNRHEGDTWSSYYTGFTGETNSLMGYEKTFAITVARGSDGIIKCELTYPARGEISGEIALTWIDRQLMRP